MPQSPSISQAEWDVMKVIWERGPLTAGQVVEALSGATDWRPRTIKTLLARLVKKGAVRCDVQDRRYVYRAARSPSAAVGGETRSFLARVFDGALLPAVVTFLKESDLSSEDAQQLKQILEREGKR